MTKSQTSPLATVCARSHRGLSMHLRSCSTIGRVAVEAEIKR
jgi:hypothetical protein